MSIPHTIRTQTARAAAAATATAVTLLLAVGCGGGSGHHALTSTTARPLDTGTGNASTTALDPTTAAILAAYRAEVEAFETVAGLYPVNPSDPRIPQYTTGKELAFVRNQLTVLKLKNHYVRGVAELHPVATSTNSSKAEVSDCDFDHSIEVDAVTNQPIAGSTPDIGHSLLHFTLTVVDGTWKVSDSTIVKSGQKEDACTPAPGS
jgi:hypothetical protein